MHTLFALEDMYGLKINDIDVQLCLTLDKYNNSSYLSLLDRFQDWYEESEKLKNEEISQENYDHWRYTYPKISVQKTKDSLKSRKINPK